MVSNIFFTLALMSLMLIGSCKVVHAKKYTDEQIVRAIRKAEGNWTYGIKTVRCDSEEKCRRFALVTIHNNRIRFAKYGYRHHPSFIHFLGSRYCPTSGGNLTESEKKLNRYWVKNVNYFLRQAEV